MALNPFVYFYARLAHALMLGALLAVEGMPYRSRIDAIDNQSAASCSQASLSSGLMALSAISRQYLAFARYSSRSLMAVTPPEQFKHSDLG